MRRGRLTRAIGQAPSLDSKDLRADRDQESLGLGMGVDKPTSEEQEQPPRLIDRLGTKGVVAIGVIVLVAIFAISLGSDDTPDPTATTAPAETVSTIPEVEGPQVAPIDSCTLLPVDAVDEALGLIDDEGRLRSSGIASYERDERCRWEAQIDDTGETVSMELGPGDQNDFAPDTQIEGSTATTHPGLGDLAVWFPGDGTGTMSAVQDTANGMLFVRLSLNRSDIDDDARRELAAEMVNTAIDRIRFGPPPPIEVDLCELIENDDAERFLAPHREGRAAARQDVFEIGSHQVVDLSQAGEWFCKKLILTEIYVTAAMAFESDFEPSAEIDGITGQPISGVGDRAVLFEDVPGGGSFASPHDTDIISVQSGKAMFRIIIALPDLAPAEQRDTAGYLALAALTRLPGADGEVVPEILETPDLSNLGFVDNLLAKEADGEWTYGEGLVATLQLFAGETGPSGVLRNQELVDDSGTEVIRMARAYVEDGPDDAVRTEVDRLLEVLGLPTRTPGVDPVGEARGSTLTASAGRLPLGVWTSTLTVSSGNLLQVDAEEEELQDPSEPAAEDEEGYAPLPDFPDDDQGYAPLPDDDQGYAPLPDFPDDDQGYAPLPDDDQGYAPLPDFPDDDQGYAPYLPPCSYSGGNGWKAWPAYSAEGVDPLKAQVIYPESGLTAGWTQVHLALTYEAIEETLNTYNASSSPCLHVVLSVHGGSSSYVLDTTTSGVCGVMLNTPMQGRQEAQFKQEIARDIAHCIIPVAWPDQFEVASFKNRRWWNGALAEFLSNVVYPDPTCQHGRCDLEWRLSGAMAAQELTIPMMSRQDANWLFFQHLQWLRGLEGVIDLANQIPASSQPIDHQKSMAGIEGMNEIFHGFIEALSDSSVRDSGGGIIAYNPPAERIQVSGKRTIQRNPEPFATKRLHLAVDPGKFACIKSSAGDNVIVTYRPGRPGAAGGGGWGPLPTEETAYSGEILVVGTTAEPDGKFKLEVTELRDDSECEEEKETEEKETPEEPDPPDVPCPRFCGPSDFYRYLDQLAAWFVEILESALPDA